MTYWHINEISQILTELDSSSETGLDSSQATARIKQSGYNELVEGGSYRSLQILMRQFIAAPILILITAAVAAGLLGETKSAAAIFIVIVIYIFLSFTREYRAEKVVAALKKMTIPNVRVLRNGKLKELSARELVPGDIVQIETGSIIPADLRLLEAVNLRIQEAMLTGESEAVEKHTATLSNEDLSLGDRRNMAYMGSIVTQGRGLALVVATGMQTELGKIANLIQQVKQDTTPFQRRLDSLGKNIAFIGIVITTLIFIIGLMRADELHHMLLAFVSVAAGIVPQGLPVVTAIILTFGAQKMLQRNALIQKLSAVETLGAVTVICSDKTGTLTENRMTVVVLDVAEHALDLTEEVERDGTLHATRGLGTPAQSSLSLAVIGGALCNDSKLIDIGDDRYHTIGDPTEGAMVVAAAKMGYWKSSLDSSFPRAAELPFDSERKRMTTVHHLEQYDPAVLAGLEVGARRYIVFTKGSVDGLLSVITHVWSDGQAQLLDAEWRSKIEASNDRLAKKGMRVLGVAFRLFDSIPEIIQTDLEQNLTLVGLFGMIDPARDEVKEALVVCRTAGIRPIMITGDHPLTAIEIARQLGIVNNPDGVSSIKALTGAEIENLTLDELRSAVEEVNVFARIAPEHKLKITQALQKNGHIVAMTGGSVNDAPALRRADIGMAMGITGTDVSKETSDIVLLDDNFATIVNSIREGRAASDTIRKFINFSMAGNIGKVLAMLLAPFVGKSLPLLPLQILWLNLLVDTLLGLGMSAEKPEADTMKRAPYSLKENFFTPTIGIGITIGAFALTIGCWYFFTDRPEWQTMIFTSLVFMQIFHALALRSEKKSLFNLGALSVTVLLFVLQLMILYIPALSKFFNLIPLSGYDLLIAAGAGLIVFIMIKLKNGSV